jgi:hypothetical protein
MRDHKPCMHSVGGDGLDILRLVQIGPLACVIDGQNVTIDTLGNLVGKLLSGK